MDNCHHHEHVVHTDECKSSVHFHNLGHWKSDCHLCDYNFAPTEEIDVDLPDFHLLQYTHQITAHQISVKLIGESSLPPLRGPPYNA